MNHRPNDETPAEHTGLGSQHYRTRLLTKLNCLIAVIEVAITKVGRSLEAPGANEQRLIRIRSNLENTLSICVRAKGTLLKAGQGSRVSNAARRDRSRTPRMGYRDYIELSSIDEYRKFKSLPPIATDEVQQTDIDDLLRRLSEL